MSTHGLKFLFGAFFVLFTSCDGKKDASENLLLTLSRQNINITPNTLIFTEDKLACIPCLSFWHEVSGEYSTVILIQNIEDRDRLRRTFSDMGESVEWIKDEIADSLLSVLCSSAKPIFLWEGENMFKCLASDFR